MILPSHEMEMSTHRLTVKIIESLVKGNQSSLTGRRVTNPATAATPRVLNSIDPRIVPSPISESVTKVLIRFVKNSGVVVAIAMKVAAATSSEI